VIEIVEADLSRPAHAEATLFLLGQYAEDLMGGGAGLKEFARVNLIQALQQRPWVKVFLAWQETEPAALAICMEGFSTFACKPLLNIHDLVVAAKFRRRGYAKQMLQKIETVARGMGCCKLTLEVLEGNRVAQALYVQCGFAGYELDPATGKALFWQRLLD